MSRHTKRTQVSIKLSHGAQLVGMGGGRDRGWTTRSPGCPRGTYDEPRVMVPAYIVGSGLPC